MQKIGSAIMVSDSYSHDEKERIWDRIEQLKKRAGKESRFVAEAKNLFKDSFSSGVQANRKWAEGSNRPKEIILREPSNGTLRNYYNCAPINAVNGKISDRYWPFLDAIGLMSELTIGSSVSSVLFSDLRWKSEIPSDLLGLSKPVEYVLTSSEEIAESNVGILKFDGLTQQNFMDVSFQKLKQGSSSVDELFRLSRNRKTRWKFEVWEGLAAFRAPGFLPSLESKVEDYSILAIVREKESGDVGMIDIRPSKSYDNDESLYIALTPYRVEAYRLSEFKERGLG